MKSALIAVDPTSEKGPSFKRFCELVRLFQSKNLLTDASIVSLIHSSLYAVPLSWYREMKGKFAKEAASAAEAACRGSFVFGQIKVLQSESGANESLVAQVSRYGGRNKNDLLVVSSNERKGLPHWILGSFSETAALTATLPILVIKPHVKESDFSTDVHFVIAVDAAAPPTSKHLRWIAKFAKAAEAKVDLVYVEPRPRPVIDSLQQRQSKVSAEEVLKKLSQTLNEAGVVGKTAVLEEAESVAHTIANYAEIQKAWATITVTAERSAPRKLLLGSTARRLLTLTKRPFLSLRLE